MGKKLSPPPPHTPSRQRLQEALEEIHTYILPVFTIEREGKEERMVPFEEAHYMKEVAQKALGVASNDIGTAASADDTTPTTTASTEPIPEQATAVKKPTTTKFTKKKGRRNGR